MDLEGTSKESKHVLNLASMGSLIVFGVVAASAGATFGAGRGLAIPLGGVINPDPRPITETSHINARIGNNNSSKPCPSLTAGTPNSQAMQTSRRKFNH